jgi:predicted RNA binding protein YcfA (HicA-like mRNA interferase family)
MKPVSGKQMCKALERQGWVHTRTKGSHFRYEKPGHPHVVVPVHGNRILKPGTQRNIMNVAGLTADDL